MASVQVCVDALCMGSGRRGQITFEGVAIPRANDPTASAIAGATIAGKGHKIEESRALHPVGTVLGRAKLRTMYLPGEFFYGSRSLVIIIVSVCKRFRRERCADDALDDYSVQTSPDSRNLRSIRTAAG